MTRKLVIVLFLIAAALPGEPQTGNAQSTYSYQWCSISSGGDAGGASMSCYYNTLQQCMATLSGIGGTCVERPHHHAQPTPLLRGALFNHHVARTVRVNTPERLLLAPPVTTAVADEPPKLDITTPCNAAAQFALLAGRDKDACVNDERMAETTLAQNWSTYSADDKSQCVGTVKTGGPSSYVELLSCIEVLQDAKQIREGDPLMRSDRPVESATQSIPRRHR
jgi:Protein of unknown function (DUF3551)